MERQFLLALEILMKNLNLYSNELTKKFNNQIIPIQFDLNDER